MNSLSDNIASFFGKIPSGKMKVAIHDLMRMKILYLNQHKLE